MFYGSLAILIENGNDIETHFHIQIFLNDILISGRNDKTLFFECDRGFGLPKFITSAGFYLYKHQNPVNLGNYVDFQFFIPPICL